MAKVKEKPQGDLFQAPAIKEKTASDEIQALKAGIGDLVTRMAAVNIKSDEDYRAAIALGTEGNEAIKRMKKEQERILEGPEGWAKRVKSAFKAIVGSIETPQEKVREQCREWNRRQEEKRQKEIAKLAEKKAAEERKIETADTALAQVNAQVKAENIQARMDSLADVKPKEQARRRVVTIIDENLIPRQFLSVDMAKLNAAKGPVGSPYPEIPGVRIQDEAQVAFR